MDLASERGVARLTSASPLAILLLALAVISFDLSAVVVNVVQLDDLSRSAANAAAQAWRSSPRASVVERAVTSEIAGDDGVVVEGIVVDDTTVWVTLQRRPPVIALDRLPAAGDRLDVAVTQRATIDPQGL